MIRLNLDPERAGNLKVLCLGCHPDDIEIGCGGAILRLREQYSSCVFQWVVFSANGVREAEAQRGAELFAGIQRNSVMLKNFRDGFMPFEGTAVKELFEDLKKLPSPDLIFTHNRKDAHQDHRLVAELTWNTFRDHLILEYEIPKYDGDMGRPSVYVPLEAEVCQKKARYILDTFKSQSSKQWFEESTFLSLMRLRGMECNAPSGYAEAFYSRKLVL
jgi:LmbE family N-acetylglucosaminyl deacetylase